MFMALWNKNPTGNGLTPPGVGGGISQEQMSLFANAAQASGLTDMAVLLSLPAIGLGELIETMGLVV